MTVQGPVKKHQSDGMSHRRGYKAVRQLQIKLVGHGAVGEQDAVVTNPLQSHLEFQGFSWIVTDSYCRGPGIPPPPRRLSSACLSLR